MSDNRLIERDMDMALKANTLPAAAYAHIVTNLPSDHVLTITCFSICSLASVIISAYLRLTAPTHVANSGNTLRSKYQTKENSKTMIIYFSLSLNELLTGIIMVILIYVIYRNDGAVEIKNIGYAAEMLDLVTAYRVLVINVALIYYWSKEKHARKVKNITSHNAEDHFKAMKEMWK
ncbi:unnamed protein product [Cylicocyclus nassatus]|uniref:Uncharacterized protein n=1 Tax=Cylicocyclus nassatus TaxID=53992 RepID=A0AA36GIC3_CYLNA|nr:unnamed protein product [Cylicocyclus nassatus]